MENVNDYCLALPYSQVPDNNVLTFWVLAVGEVVGGQTVVFKVECTRFHMDFDFEFAEVDL